MRGLNLPLKQTAPVEIVKNFETHIAKKYGKEAVPSVHPTFEEMQRLRNGLDFGKMQAQLNNDYRLAADFQTQIIQYLRYVYLADNFFKNDFADAKYLKPNYTWTDSFQPTKKPKAINHIKYELASCLYNLAVCYYTEGVHLIASPQAQDKLKGTGKLRAALWCVNEIKQILPTLLANPNDIPSDLNLSYVNLLYNYIIGLTYTALVEVLGTDTKKNGPEKLASINKAAAKHFQIAYDILNALKMSPLPEQQTKAFKMNLLFNATMFRSDAYFQIAQIHLQKVDEEILKGHMGLAVSYLRIPKTDFDALFQRKAELDFLSFDQKAQLQDRSKIIYSNYENCALRNNRVYKQQEFAPEHLPEIPEEKTAITPNEPKDIKKKLEEERNFEVFLSPEIVAIKADFMNYVSMKMLEVENSLKNANNVKNKIYSESYVNYLLDLESQSGDKKFDIPPQLKSKIEKFKKNGGFNAYAYTKKNILETSGNCGRMLEEVKAVLAKEKEEDENLRRQYPSQWNRAYSEQVNQEYVFKLRDLEQKFFIAQNTDKDVFKKYDQYQEWMQKFSLPDDQILQLIPRSSDNDFVTKNKPKLSELVGLNGKIIELMDLEKQRNYLLTTTEEFMKSDFIPNFAAINNKQVDKQGEFDKMIIPYQTKLSQIEGKINEAYPLLDSIATLAKGMNSTRSESNQSAVKVLEEMNLATTVINDIYNDFQQGLHFYTNLTFHMNALQKVVNDFCLARDIEKNALLQELQAQTQYSNNFNNPKPYFQENSMQFPKGTSVFVTANQHLPQNQQQQQQQQSNYPPQNQQGGGGGYANTQMYKPPQNPSQNYSPQGQTHTQMYNPNQQGGQGQGITQTQMYNPNQGQTHTQMYNPNQNQGPTYTQMYNPNQQGQGQTQTQMYNPNQQYNNQGQGQGQNQGGFYGNNQVTSQTGYMPLSNPEAEGGAGQFGGFGNIVESTFIGGNKMGGMGGNPYQQGKPGGY